MLINETIFDKFTSLSYACVLRNARVKNGTLRAPQEDGGVIFNPHPLHLSKFWRYLGRDRITAQHSPSYAP